MLTSQLLANVRRIEIRTRRIVDQIAGGAYHSVFKGRGIEFNEAREYTDDDDARDIDWNITARFGRPFVKKYVEERELSVMLMVDVSGSGDCGAHDRAKNEAAAELAALLAFSALRNNDRVGLHMFSSDTEIHLSPRKGRRHALRLIRELLARPRKHQRTDIGRALQQVIRTLHRRSIVFLISDMLDDNYENPLIIAGHRHDMIAVRLNDPCELHPLPVGWLAVEDAENHEMTFFHGGKEKARARFAEETGKMRENTEKICRRANVDLLDLFVDQDIIEPLMSFFNQRKKRR